MWIRWIRIRIRIRNCNTWFLLFFLHDGMIRIREVQKHTDSIKDTDFEVLLALNSHCLGRFLTIGKVFLKAGMVSHSKAVFSHAGGMGYSSFDLCWRPLQGNMI
jgi:hypothetical protein